MKWFRMFSEARNDGKLRSLTDAQHRTWFRLLCYAAEQDRRGIIEGRTLKVLALEVTDGNETLLRETCEVLAEYEMIEFDVAGAPRARIVFKSFARRQFFSKCDDKESARSRAAKSRANRRKERVTASHSESQKVTANSVPISDSETDSETEKNAPVAPPTQIRKTDPSPDPVPSPAGSGADPDPDIEPFHSPPVMAHPGDPGGRSGRDLAEWNAAIERLRKTRETAPLAGSMEMNAEDGRVSSLEGWRFLQAARVIGQPGKSATWGFFLGCVRNATRAEFERWGAKESQARPRSDPEPRRLPEPGPESPFWKLSAQFNTCLDKHAL